MVTYLPRLSVDLRYTTFKPMTAAQRTYFIKNGNDDMNIIIKELDRPEDWTPLVWFAIKYPRFPIGGCP